MGKFNKEQKKRPKVRYIDRERLELFLSKDWPGNIRELEKTIKRMMLSAEGNTLHFSTLPNKYLFPFSEKHDSKFREIFPLTKAYDILRKNMVLKAMALAGGNALRTSKMLGISREHLSRLIKQYKLGK